MRKLTRLTALLLSLLMLLSAVPAQAENIKIGPLTDGIPFTDALTIVCAIAQNAEAEVDFSTLKYDEKNNTCTVRAGVFTLHVQADGNANACSVGISAAYLDAEYARQMGLIFGGIMSTLSDVDSIEALSGMDFNAFNTLKPSQQTLIFGDYKITMTVDPDSTTPYSFTLALKTPVPVVAGAEQSTEDARLILGRMNIDVSAAFLYDESTDLNGKLGQEGSYYSKINFARTALAPKAVVSASLSVDQGGSIEVFATHAQAVERSNYITSKLKLTGGKEHHFAYGGALLRLSPDTSPEDVGKMITAFIIAVDGDFAPGLAPAATATPKPTATPVPAVKKGDKVTFGSYEQDNNTGNGKEPIQWLVADVTNGEALLVSVYALDVYNTYWGAPTWDKSTLRTWMNGTFYNSAFSAKEKAVILTSTVKADKHPYYTSNPGSTTQDKVFSLSYVEADSLLTASQRKCEPTTYAKKAGKVYTEGKYCYWWLRTPGRPGCGAAIVCTDGSYDYDASYDGFCYGARPCIRVPADSPLLKK
ncbi:MAG: hypothetical protein IKL25_08440 [Clostridia bacterium]|nr:hypothetical protein [Clostridia bacterium]